jgi:sugar transferase (PEP-CTERM system associated)
MFKARVVVLGTGGKATRIADIVKARKNRYFLPLAYLRLGNQPVTFGAAPTQICDSDPAAIVRMARNLRATEIVVATDDRRGLPVHQLLQCRLEGISVIDYLDFLERETMSVDLAAVQPGWFIFSDGFRGCGPAQLGKRCFDITISLLLLLFTLPLMMLTWLLIALESPGSALYRQERVGLFGKPFVLLKFRSMRIDAENDGKAQWARTNDPRVTRVGSIIRKLRIDELPQLWNVLRGDMSFVGPRPERPAFVSRFTEQIPFYAERHCVRPGITGWAQINYPYGASLEDARNKLSYDLYYVKNHGLFLDILIAMQTFRVILSADGAR